MGGPRAHRGVPPGGVGAPAVCASCDRVLSRLLLSASAAERTGAQLHAYRRRRACEHRLPIRPLAILRRVAPRVVLHPARQRPLRSARRSRARTRSPRQEDRTMNVTLVLFLIVVGITLVITGWAARRTRTTVQFWAAGRGIKGWQNGLAISGDYMSAASFLGIAGLIAFNGYDGFMYSVGWLVAYLTVLFLIAEPMRNTGKYTLADVISYRMSPIPVRSAAAFSTVAVSASYMMAQMIGAGSLIKILIPSLDTALKPWFNWTVLGTKLDPSITLVGALMMIYVIAGGMVATTWVQIVKAILLMSGAVLLSFLVLLHFGFNLGSFFDSIAGIKDSKSGLNFTQPGILYAYGKTQAWGVDKALLENVSLGMALILGTAGLPHILMRFFTVPDAKAARQSVAWAMGLIGSFYIMTTFLGFGAATLVGKTKICATVAPKCTPNSNLAAPRLAEYLGNSFFGTGGGEFLLAFIAAGAFWPTLPL